MSYDRVGRAPEEASELGRNGRHSEGPLLIL